MCTTPPAGALNVGPLTKYASDGMHKTTTGAQAVLIGRDAGGLWALSAICTHDLCNMDTGNGTITATSITCTCHGSIFHFDGKVQKGPASKALVAYELVVCPDGNVYVDKSKIVPAAQRFVV
jgi:nitrite reductase/ring-hydroxylating ferredoxin subunit